MDFGAEPCEHAGMDLVLRSRSYPQLESNFFDLSEAVFAEGSLSVYQGKGARRGKAERLVNHRGPMIPPQKNYEPTRSAQKPSGYAEIETASQLAQGAPEFLHFVREVVKMPEALAPAVAEAIRQQKWKIAPNPLGTIRTAAHQEARRMGIQ
jgi:hypothetical protein